MTRLYLRLFGGVRLDLDGVPAAGRAAHRRRLAILALLSASPGHRVGRERIISLLWPEAETDAARKLLSESLYVIRRELKVDAIGTARDELFLNDDLVRSDVADFRRAIAAKELRRAAALYTGDFMDAWHVDEAPEFERWATREREDLRRTYADSLRLLAEECEERQSWTEAITWREAHFVAEPFGARSAMALARAQATAGERAAAIRTLTTYEAHLRAELDVPPEPEVVALAEELRNHASGTVVRRGSFPAAYGTPPVASAPTPDPRTPVEATARPTTTTRIRVFTGAVALAALVLSAWGLQSRAEARRPGLDPNDIAVRPFVDLTGRNGAFAYALTDELIVRLTGVAPLRVASRGAILQLSDDAVGIDSVGRALGVGTVIEGTVQEANGKVSVTALITDVSTGRYIGAAEVTRSTGDYFGLLDDIAASIERSFRRRLGEKFRLRELTRGTHSNEAIRLVADGQRRLDLARQVSREWRPDAVQSSRAYLTSADSAFQLAIRMDGGWPVPAVKRAQVASLLAASESPDRAVETLGAGIRLLDRALTVNPGHAAALEMRGRLRFQRYLTYATGDTTDADARAAVDDFERAKSVDSLRVGAWTGRAFAAWFSQDTATARVNLDGASRLDAYLDGETDILKNQFLVALWLRDWRTAQSACRTGRREDPWNYWFLQCELTLARHDRDRTPHPAWAWRIVDTLLLMHPADKAVRANRRYVPIYWRVVAATLSARAGQTRRARSVMDSAVAHATRDGVTDDLAPDRAFFEWQLGDTARAVSVMAEFLRARPQHRAGLRADAILGPIVERADRQLGKPSRDST